jgi:type III pantothenate kinase
MEPNSGQINIVAVDIGNSRVQCGFFDSVSGCVAEAQSRLLPIAASGLPQPASSLKLTLSAQNRFAEDKVRCWYEEVGLGEFDWFVASVNRPAEDYFQQVITELGHQSSRHRIRRVSHRDIMIPLKVPFPERVGIDRLLAATAANQLRTADRPIVVVDHGSAMTVDLVDATGAFVGGAILPGIAMGAHALAEGTDALPLVSPAKTSEVPLPIGNETEAAIQSGLYWAAVGAIRSIVEQIALSQTKSPMVCLTGGVHVPLAENLTRMTGLEVRYVPQMVLAGIALVAGGRFGGSK